MPDHAVDRGPQSIDVSVILPCLNEEETVGLVVDEARQGLASAGLAGEILVVDNDSSDDSAAVAVRHGAIVLREERRGYGSAYLTGLAAARGRFLVLADADGTYDLSSLARLVEELERGADLVLGSRLRGEISPKAMPWAHRWIGNPVLTGILNVFFRAGVSDAHSGIRALRRSALEKLDLGTPGMEFASEMVVKAAKRGLTIAEVPVSYRPRRGESKLSPYRDAWRHMRFMLLHSPTFLFLVPGGASFLVGLAALFVLAPGPVSLFGRTWEIHSAIVASLLTLVGAQIIQLGLFARTYAVLYLGESDPALERAWRVVRLEHGLLVGALVLLGGLGVLGYVVATWARGGFGALHEEHLSVVALTLIGLGVQTLFGSFFLSILGLQRRRRTKAQP